MKTPKIRRHTYRINVDSLRKQICGKQKMPKIFEYCGLIDVPIQTGAPVKLQIHVIPHIPILRKSSMHRIYVQCHFCGRFISAGRISQHTC